MSRPRIVGFVDLPPEVEAALRLLVRQVVDSLPARLDERVALRWPDEVAAALGVSRSWLYDSGLAGELRFVRHKKTRLVAVHELERAIDKRSARWDEKPARDGTNDEGGTVR